MNAAWLTHVLPRTSELSLLSEHTKHPAGFLVGDFKLRHVAKNGYRKRCSSVGPESFFQILGEDSVGKLDSTPGGLGTLEGSECQAFPRVVHFPREALASSRSLTAPIGSFAQVSILNDPCRTPPITHWRCHAHHEHEKQSVHFVDTKCRYKDCSLRVSALMVVERP